MTTETRSWAEDYPEVAGGRIRLRRGGSGPPVLVLHHDFGNPGWLPFHERLAAGHDVLLPDHPGYEGSDRPDWLRSVRDLAVLYQALLADLDLRDVALVGLGFGGWIAAELATMAPTAFRRLVLVNPFGIQPSDGYIHDQALDSHIDYVRAGFHDQAAFDRTFGAEPETDLLLQWDANREMSFRIAWKPYMYSQTLPHLLGGVRAPALVIWSEQNQVVPRSTAERYIAGLRAARLVTLPDCGHLAEIEQPDALAAIIVPFLAGA